jgi:hypothetical protein
VGFFDLLSESPVLVEEPRVTRQRLRQAFGEEARTFFAGH